MFITLLELVHIVLMSAIVAYIFTDFFSDYNGNNFKNALIITAPAIILHELAHKFVAMGFGLEATFRAAYGFLALGLLLKLMNFGIIFFVPAYVSITGITTPLRYALIAVSGPLVNLILWIGSLALLKTEFGKQNYKIIYLCGRINMYLFILNMLPLPGFDGHKFFVYLIKALI